MARGGLLPAPPILLFVAPDLIRGDEGKKLTRGRGQTYMPSRRLMPCSIHILSAQSICDQPWQLP